MKILQSRSFDRKVKKFAKREKKQLDKQIRKIIDNPSIGSEKKGDLRGIYVHKFSSSGLLSTFWPTGLSAGALS